MASEARLKIRGLYSHPNPYGSVPEGALETADNVVIDREDIASPRRGYEALEFGFGTGTDRAHQLTEYQEKLLAHYATSKLAYYDDSTGFQDYSGTFNAPSGTKVRFTQSNGNLYFTTASGVKKLDAYNGTPSAVGIPKAIQVTAALSAAVGTWFTTDNQVAYRVLWGIRDANNNVIQGAPSQRVELANSLVDTKDVNLTIYIPDDITTAHFYKVYRSSLSGGASIEADDELQLVYESNPTSTDITNGYLTFTDETPDDFLGETLYTAGSQEGILQSNDQPPLAKDLAVYREHLFYANTTGKHSLTLSLLGVGGTNGLQADDTIEIGGITYTAKAAESVASAEFQRFTAGSAAENILDTALSLINVINQHSANTSVYAYYVSLDEEPPGKIRIEERGVGGSSFDVVTNNATAWDQDLTGSGKTSTNDTWKNALYFSKPQQPEAVPLINYKRIGSADDPILRIVALRDSLLIFKQREGIYRLTGTDASNLNVDLLDSSTRLLAPETVTVLNNQVFGLFDQGVCTVSDTGVDVVSRSIEKTFLELQGATLSTVKTLGWAVSYESDRKYILNLPSRSSDTNTTQAYVYNVFTRAWVRWTIEKSCGLVRPSEDKLYFGDATAARVSKERKSYTFRDHVDEALSVNVTAIDGLTVTLDDVSQVAVGDVLSQSSTLFSNITSVDSVASTVTISYDPGFTVAAASVLKAFTSTLKWMPFHGGEPLMSKQFREVSLMFERQARNATLKFSTEIAKAEGTVSVTGSSVGSWGSFPWGSVPWGGTVGQKVVRTWVTREHARGNVLSVTWSHGVGYSLWALADVQVVFQPVGERTTR